MAMTTAIAATSASFSGRTSTTRSSAVLRPRAAVAGAGGRVRDNGKWWAPLLGWSGKADYIEAAAPVVEAVEESKAARRAGLTEAKARELRARMAGTESFHDAMYHSAIASRLARSS